MAKRKSKKPAKPSTALAVRKPAKQTVIINDPQGMMPRPGEAIGQLGELATVGSLGLAEMKLTPEENAVLDRPVNSSDIQFKPLKGGGFIPFLPHIVYTRWFNDAFGRTGWSIVPTAKPAKGGNLVYVPYLLYIHGKPVAYAVGEYEYFENNPQQSFGDAIESTVGSALRRFAKRLGIGLEMWDKAYLESVPRPNGKRSAPPRERVEESFDALQQQLEPAPERVITKAEWERLHRIAEKHGRAEVEVRLWLTNTYGPLPKIAGKHVKAIERALEARGPLPMPGDGEA